MELKQSGLFEIVRIYLQAVQEKSRPEKIKAAFKIIRLSIGSLPGFGAAPL
jgi:hypothetical protein